MSSPANLHKNIAAGLYKPPEMRYNIPAGRLFAAKIPLPCIAPAAGREADKETVTKDATAKNT